MILIKNKKIILYNEYKNKIKLNISHIVIKIKNLFVEKDNDIEEDVDVGKADSFDEEDLDENEFDNIIIHDENNFKWNETNSVIDDSNNKFDYFNPFRLVLDLDHPIDYFTLFFVSEILETRPNKYLRR